MPQQSSPGDARSEGCLAALSRWATAPLMVPFLTGLDFAATPIFTWGYGKFGSWYDEMGFFLSMPLLIVILCFAVGFGLGFPLRRAMLRIRDAHWSGVLVFFGVAFAWVLTLFGQWFLALLIMSSWT